MWVERRKTKIENLSKLLTTVKISVLMKWTFSGLNPFFPEQAYLSPAYLGENMQSYLLLPPNGFWFRHLLFPGLLNWLALQGCALRKIEGSPVLLNCKIQGAHHMICLKNLRFSSRPRAKVRRQGPPGSARAQPCTLH